MKFVTSIAQPQGNVHLGLNKTNYGTEWKVYDVVIDQVSLVANYRSQFDRVLQTASLEELLRRLRAKGSGRQS